MKKTYLFTLAFLQCFNGGTQTIFNKYLSRADCGGNPSWIKTLVNVAVIEKFNSTRTRL